ncbi:hypothetical protein [Falsiroseomonas sp. E2-1-a20]|uniref:hypothetical protein n=1 Tax=Falsiroseomonas sp. E2-1-a20 TaxID=3239300 RepID=UPI003F372384
MGTLINAATGFCAARASSPASRVGCAIVAAGPKRSAPTTAVMERAAMLPRDVPPLKSILVSLRHLDSVGRAATGRYPLVRPPGGLLLLRKGSIAAQC